MATSADPNFHRAAEQRMIDHVLALLEDARFVVDTTRGRRPVTALIRNVTRGDRSVDVQRTMSEMNRPDRELLSRMPAGQQVDVSLSIKQFIFFPKTIGHVRVVCVSPTRDLVNEKDPAPMSSDDVQKILRGMPPPVAKVPMTVVLVSTSGFARESRELAGRTAERTLVLAEPNAAGGWTVHGPVEIKALVDLLDPEAEDEKRNRIRGEIESAKFELTGGGISADRIAANTKLSLQLVEQELKSFAKQNAGHAAKRLDGRVVLFREGTMPASTSSSSSSSGAKASGAAGGGLSDMPLIDRIKTLFSRKGENEKKIAFLSERRAMLSQQRDRAYEEITNLEAKDVELVDQFKSARAPLTKRRVTSQLVQLRKDIERRQQMIAVLNQQVNVVNTHLHNLELTAQGQRADLPDSEEIAADAAAAEEMLAQLEADNELADSVGSGTTSSATVGMSAEEQALFEELEAENNGGAKATSEDAPAREPSKSQTTPDRQRETPARETPRRSEPEAS